VQRRSHLRTGEFIQKAAKYGYLLLLFLWLVACAPVPVSTMEVLPAPSVSPTRAETNTSSAPLPQPIPTDAATTTVAPLSPDSWQTLPVIPTGISDRVREIYRLGLSLGNNPHVFSRIGDCASAAPAFLTSFDRDYDLDGYAYLQPVIDYFKGSFERPSLAAKAGLNTAGVLTTLWTDEQCKSNESLLDCQYRLDHPAFAIISLGTNEAYYVHHAPGSFERNMRQIIEDTTAQGTARSTLPSPAWLLNIKSRSGISGWPSRDYPTRG
jgi:hypothetical protein